MRYLIGIWLFVLVMPSCDNSKRDVEIIDYSNPATIHREDWLYDSTWVFPSVGLDTWTSIHMIAHSKSKQMELHRIVFVSIEAWRHNNSDSSKLYLAELLSGEIQRNDEIRGEYSVKDKGVWGKEGEGGYWALGETPLQEIDGLLVYYVEKEPYREVVSISGDFSSLSNLVSEMKNSQFGTSK